MTGSHADAEDVVQEACLRAFRAIDSVDETTARAWVLTIVHNAACTWLAKNRPAILVDADDLETLERQRCGRADTADETPESILVQRSDRADLERAIASLPLAFRETLILREIEGLNYRQIAQVTGVPIGTVMSRLSRAREQIIGTIVGSKT